MVNDIDLRISERCEVIAELVQNMQKMYRSSTTSDYQRNHIQVIIGAGIWYIPNSDLWSGKISVEAVKDFHPTHGIDNPKLSKDHQYPRKVAAKTLLDTDWSTYPAPGREITRLFIEKFGTYNYVTPSENRNLMKYQTVEVFVNPKDAYEKANIQLVSVSENNISLIKKRDKSLIEDLLDTLCS
ncbi:MAG: hypothetical protein WBB69_10260 [Anaerolineales bacterium]